jgi:hypothetical protein
MSNYERQSQAIAQGEHECERSAIGRAQNLAAPASSTAGATASSEPLIAECKAQAQKDNGQLASHQRVEYEQRAREERDRAALMMTLTTSLQR